MKLLERLLPDPEKPLEPYYDVVPDEEFEPDEAEPDQGDEGNAAEARKTKPDG